MEDFTIGDRVITTPSYTYPSFTGTIVSRGENVAGDLVFGVDLDIARVNFHNCSGNARPGHGRYIQPCFLSLLEEEPEPRRSVEGLPDLSAILGGI